MADEVRRAVVPDPQVVTWQIDRNVNITNVCISGCKFCNFHCKPHQTDRAFITTMEQYCEKIDRTLRLGGDQLLLQGGLHPGLKIDFYERLFSGLKSRYPSLRLHALGAPEVAHIARISGLTTLETLRRLMAAGLDSLPGAGAEMLDSDVRRAISPAKPSVEKWLDVMHEAHCRNLPTSATMMYGHVETPHQRIDHLLRIRDLQTRCPEGNPGFIAFIPWIFRSTGTELEPQGVETRFLAAGIPPHHRREPADAAQYPQHSGFVAHRGPPDGTGGPPQRSQRHGVDHDRRERRIVGRGPQQFRRRRHSAGHPRSGLHPAPAGPTLRTAAVAASTTRSDEPPCNPPRPPAGRTARRLRRRSPPPPPPPRPPKRRPAAWPNTSPLAVAHGRLDAVPQGLPRRHDRHGTQRRLAGGSRRPLPRQHRRPLALLQPPPSGVPCLAGRNGVSGRVGAGAPHGRPHRNESAGRQPLADLAARNGTFTPVRASCSWRAAPTTTATTTYASPAGATACRSTIR